MCIIMYAHVSHTYLALIMHNVYMRALCNCVYLVRIPRRDHMYLAYCMHDSRRDFHDMRSRSPKLLMRRSRSCLVENDFVDMYIVS